MQGEMLLFLGKLFRWRSSILLYLLAFINLLCMHMHLIFYFLSIISLQCRKNVGRMQGDFGFDGNECILNCFLFRVVEHCTFCFLVVFMFWAWNYVSFA